MLCDFWKDKTRTDVCVHQNTYIKTLADQIWEIKYENMEDLFNYLKLIFEKEVIMLSRFKSSRV